MENFLLLLLVLSLQIFAAQAQEQDEIEFVIEFFNELQPLSIAQNREYCGYFGLDENDNIVATKPTRGEEDSCYADDPPEDLFIFASYHTHGSFSVDADSELPSLEDLQADIAEGVDGYIATPGGRIWFLDNIEEKAILICGRNCTISDDRYDDDAYPPVQNEYDLKGLEYRYKIVEDFGDKNKG